MRARIAAALMALLVLASPLAAQETRGTIEGIIKDASGAVLPGVSVEVRGINVGGALTAVTDAAGVYRFPALPPGRYQVTAALQGFTSSKSEQVDLQLGQVLKVDLSMALAGVTESVQVTAESPLIDVKQSVAGQNISADFIDRLPKGRDFTTIVTLAAGANSETRSGGISIDGASASENRYFIDGTDTTNLRTGLSAKPLLNDFIEQIQVKSSGYAAEFGGSTGGVINVVTKSGTNTFHGEGGTYFNNDAMQGDERPTLRLVLTGQNASEYVTLAKDDFKRWEPFFQFGGPIARDKVWFYGAYSPQIDETGRTVTFRSNSQTGTYISKEKTHYLTGNVTAQITNALRARATTSYSEYNQDGRLPAKDGSSNAATNFAGLGRKQPNLSTNGQVDYALGNKVFLNGKASWLSYDTQDTGVPSDIWVTFSGSNGVYPGATNVQPNGYNSVLTNSASVRDLYTRLGLSGDATFFATAGGRHAIKTGVQFQRIRNDVFSAEQAPHITFNWNASRPTLDGRTVRGTYGYYSWRQFGTIGDVHVNNLGFFVQDDWSIGDRLTLNLGIRTEREDVPSYVPGLNGIKFGFGDKFAPRAGFAYDLRGDGKWKAFGSYGMFYDIMKLELPRGAFGGDKWIEQYYTLDTLDYLSIGPNGNFPGTYIESVNFRISSNDPSCPECGAIDPDLKPMRQQEASAGVEHQLSNFIALTARYVHKQVDRAIEDTGFLLPDGSEGYVIANPGEGITELAFTNPRVNLPKAKRDYDAVELRFEKRLSNRWYLNAGYTWSRLYGNYSGLTQSDENGRTSPNVGRLFDYPAMMFDQHGQPVFGVLATDRTNQFKTQFIYQFPFHTTVSVNQYIASGLPVSREIGIFPGSNYPLQYLGRNSDGRTDTYSQTDLYLQHEIPLSTQRLQVYLNVFNVFNQDAAVSKFSTYQRTTSLTLDEAALYRGELNFDQMIQQQAIERDPRFLMNNGFQAPIAARFGVKFLF